MREKELKLVVAFHTTAAAMALEKAFVQAGVPGRLIPVPREIAAGCGMAWCAPSEARRAVEKAAKAAGIEAAGYYEMLL